MEKERQLLHDSLCIKRQILEKFRRKKMKVIYESFENIKSSKVDSTKANATRKSA